MARLDLALLLTLAIAAPAAAQQHAPVTMLPVPPLPPIGLPLPHIGLPVPDQSTADRSRIDERGGHAPGDRQDHRGRRGGRTAIIPLYFAPIYVLEATPSASSRRAAPAPAPEAAEPESATLRLDVEPAVEMQLYVDGYYIAVSDGTDAIELTAGAHDVELRAPGYEPLTFGVRLSSRQPVLYRDRLTPLRAAVTSDRAPSPATPMTLYVIPGCYAGNVPPDSTTLPAGCDPSRAITVDR